MSDLPFLRAVRRWRCAGLAAIVGICFLDFSVRAQSPGAINVDTNPPAPRRPCIIFILADDLGYGEVGCYGQTKIKTPNIDKLAAEGMRFTSFYSGDTLSAGSRTALLTGLHTGHARMRGSATVPFEPGDVTVPELLKQSGYATAAIGKWGLGEIKSSLPSSKGFGEWYGYVSDAQAHNYYPPSLDRTREGENHLIYIPENQDGKKGKYSCDMFTDAAVRYVSYSKPEEFTYFRPFFLYLAYTIPHANIELGQQTGNGMEVPNDAPYTGESWPQPEKNKAAMITRLDGYVGQLMDKLKETQNDRNTIIIFTSDNGPHKEGGVDPKFFNGAGPFRGMKRDLYEGGIRVPMIVRWPVGIKANTTSDLPLAFWDILPTFAEIARFPVPRGIDGISFLPTLQGHAQTNRHEFLYWEVHDNGFKQAVRMGDWKAVRLSAEGPLELYNLKTDPAEKDNVAEKNHEVLTKIEEYLKTARTDDPHWPVQKAPPAAGAAR